MSSIAFANFSAASRDVAKVAAGIHPIVADDVIVVEITKTTERGGGG
jgi:hypothetical protein